jgi:hypothetical protein
MTYYENLGSKLWSLRSLRPGCLVAYAVWTMVNKTQGWGGGNDSAKERAYLLEVNQSFVRPYNTFLSTTSLFENKRWRRTFGPPLRWRTVHKE